MEKKVQIEEPVTIAGVKLTLISEVSIGHLTGKGRFYFHGVKRPVAVEVDLTGAGPEILYFNGKSLNLSRRP